MESSKSLTAAATELGLETLEVSLVLDNLNEGLEINALEERSYHLEFAMKKYVVKKVVIDYRESLYMQRN